MTQPAYRIELLSEPPAPEDIEPLLYEYYPEMIAKIVDLGGPDVDPREPVRDFWDHIDSFLPPNGQTCLARGPDGGLLGCGTLSQFAPGLGELKRLYVRPAARGTGLGRALVQTRIDAARAMGLKALCVDTVASNLEMQRLYARMGFQMVDDFPQSATLAAFPQLRDVMVFLRMEL